jgi:RimJ/RimL family protein N-acetyltransferase
MRLETDRLILRPWEDRDRSPLAAILGDAHVRRFYPAVASPEETNAQIDSAIAKTETNGFHFQAAELKSTGELVGLIGIGVIPDYLHDALRGHPRVEIGWQFGRQFWGRGLAPEGAHGWLDYAWTRLDLDEVVAFTARVNLPSQRVMEKIGMTRDSSDDFDHPRLAADDPLCAHVLYRAGNPTRPTA